MVPIAYMPSPIPRQVGWNLFARTIPFASAFPRNRGGSAPALVFSRPAQRSLTLRPARSPSRLATLCTRGFSSLVASTAALIATGWNEPVPGRVYLPLWTTTFHGAPGCTTYQASETESVNTSAFLSTDPVKLPTSGLRAEQFPICSAPAPLLNDCNRLFSPADKAKAHRLLRVMGM
jgi:hypothetical protein